MDHFRRASAETGIPVDLLIAQARQESSFNPNARGAAGEIGIFQIKPSTAQQPGFGLTGVDPGTLTDPGANIMFGARYLRGRMGQGDPNNPADQARALAAYNGGGDPNYVANVNRYRPGQSLTDPARAVTTYTPGAPPAPGTPPPYQVATTGAVPPPPGAPPGATPAVPAATPAPGATPPAQQPPAATVAPPPPRQQNGLTAEQNQDLARLRSITPTTRPQMIQLQQAITEREAAYRQHNETVDRQYQTDQLAAQREERNASNQAITTNIAISKEQREAEKERRAAAELALRGPTGEALTNQDRRMLLSAYDKPDVAKTPEYAAAYANLATPRVAEGGLQVNPDMTPFKLPQDNDGKPILSYGQPRIVIGPGDLSKYRAIDEQFTTITHTLDTLQKAWESASATERAETLAGRPTTLRTAWTNAALLSKGAGLFELGVISGPDQELLRGVLSDPTTFWGSLTSTATATKQIGMVKDLLGARRAAAQRAYGGGMAIGSGGGGGSAGSKPRLKFDAQGNLIP
jgi:hypothetical protein